MEVFKKIYLLEVLLLLSFSLATSRSKEIPFKTCGGLRIQAPFFLQNTTNSSPLDHLLLCKSQKLYLRTSVGLFQISSIDYSSKLLTVSHSFCSSTSHFLSPSHLTAGLPVPPQPNSLFLFNCTAQANSASPYIRNCSTDFHGCGGSFSKLHLQQLVKGPSSCLLVEDADKLDPDFHPRSMNCTHYSRMYRNASVDGNIRGFELGTRISFDVHVHNPCDECRKPNGNCGAGLRCVCHPKECKDKVFSFGVKLNPFGGGRLFFLCFGVVMYLFNSSS